MKKIASICAASVLFSSSFVYAGSMGEDGSSCFAPFVSLEGGYTANKINGYSFSSNVDTITYTSVKKKDQYTGRLAVGILSMMDDQFGFTGELGWGYYGRTTLTPPTGLLLTIPASVSSRYTLTGFDALLGAAYIQTYYSLFFKAGAVIQNMQENSTSYPNIASIAVANIKHNSTAVLPAIKLGIGYNIDYNWTITGSYLFAYGASRSTSISYDGTADAYTLNANNQNPMMNTLMLGIQYTV